MQEVARAVVEAGHAVADDVAHGRRNSGRPFSGAEHARVVEQPGQLPDEERVAGSAGVDGPGDGVTGIVAGLAADERRHVGQPHRAEPEPAVAGQPAGRGQHLREIRTRYRRAVTERANDGCTRW